MHASAVETSDLARLYTFAVWMIGDRAQALARAGEVIRAAPEQGFASWAMAVLAPLAGAPGRTDRPAVFRVLDEVLRTDLTISPGDHPQIRRDPSRLRVLQWELKRGCLYAVMRGVAVTPRAAFVLVKLLGHSVEEVAAMLRVTMSSIRVSVRRCEQTLDDYLGARCQHMAPGNNCQCEKRLGVALGRGFVDWPERSDEMPDAPVFTQTHSDVGSLYRALPGFTLDLSAANILMAAQQTRPDSA